MEVKKINEKGDPKSWQAILLDKTCGEMSDRLEMEKNDRRESMKKERKLESVCACVYVCVCVCVCV